ncbi:MAG: hypothetical protein ABIG39_03950 [Candidatus Micrarchaeota archaeon]
MTSKPSLLDDRFEIGMQILASYTHNVNGHLSTISLSTGSANIREHESITTSIGEKMKAIRDEVSAIATMLKKCTFDFESERTPSGIGLKGNENEIMKSVVKILNSRTMKGLKKIEKITAEMDSSQSTVPDSVSQSKKQINTAIQHIREFLDKASGTEQFSPVLMSGQTDRYCADFS